MFLRRPRRQCRCDRIGLGGQILQGVVERVAGEVKASIQRLVDARLEPRLDAFPQELYRDAVDECAWNNADHREEQDEAQPQLRAEDVQAKLAPQAEQLIADEQHQCDRDRYVQREQKRIVFGEARRVRGGGSEQEERHCREHHDQHEHVAEPRGRADRAGPFVGAHHGVTVQRAQSDPMFHSRAPSAFN